MNWTITSHWHDGAREDLILEWDFAGTYQEVLLDVYDRTRRQATSGKILLSLTLKRNL